jgi:valyl-tRNA synthetase
MLGDTAVAVNPKDKRYKKYIGKTLVLPLINREIKIICDSMVDMKFGTGAVKVTPAHDPNDYALGKKLGLEFINVMHPDGRMNEFAGDYNGMDRFEARKVILEDLKEKGLLEKAEPHQLSAGHCYRCHTIVEPYLSKQWFVKMKPLAQPAIEVVKKGKIKFYPQRWTKVYLNWMENIQDWCISRQIWWGHRIPVYYCRSCQETGILSIANSQWSIDKTKTIDHPCLSGRQGPSTIDPIGIIVSRTKPEKCPDCNSTDIYQDEDVLDTWFSSWLWPFATFYWPIEAQGAERKAQSEQDLKYFYPTSVLVTAPEIIFFWVARMIMSGLEFMRDIPFRDVYIHGTVRDIEGKKMSKSLGNIIDPLGIIDEYGTDALRFSLVSITAQGQDVFLSKEKFEQGRNFANKIWNASRFILMNLNPDSTWPDLCEFHRTEDLGLVNRWILSRFYSVLKEVGRNLDEYRFNDAANALYGFFWHEFCDWYLELVKPILVNRAQSTEYRHTQVVMYKVLEKFLRVMHPLMPFIAEEIWQRIPHQGKSIMLEPWPHVQEQMIDEEIEKRVGSLFGIITQIRNLRSSLEIKPEQKVKVSLYPQLKSEENLIEENSRLIMNLARLESLDLLHSDQRPKAVISAVFQEVDIYLHFGGIVDTLKEQQKTKKRLEEVSKIIKSKESRLSNPDFIKRAPPEIVEKEKEDLAKLNDERKRLEKMLHELC